MMKTAMIERLIIWYQQKTIQQQIWLFGAFAVLLIVTGIGLRDPWPADEPRFALIAKEMVDSGQWFFPSRAGEYYPDKPPVFMWAIALFYQLTDSLNLAFLLPSALGALLTLFLIVDLGSRLWSPQIGLTAGWLLLFSLQFTLQAKTAQIDAMVCAFITIGCYGLLRFMLYDGLWRWYYMAWVAMGLGVITKGVGFLPALMLLPYIWYRLAGQGAPIVRSASGNSLRWLLGPIMMLLTIGCWFFPLLIQVTQSQDPMLLQYRDNILWKQTVTRYADSWHHIKPFGYYLVEVIPVFWLPLSLAIPWLAPHWWQALKQYDGRVLLPLFWIILVLIFFAVSPGKRGVYILPALPMLALIAAPYAERLLQHKGLNRGLWGLVAVLSALFGLLGLAGVLGLKAATKLADRFDVTPWFFLLTLGVAGVLILAIAKRATRWLSWPLFISLFWLLYSTWGYQMLESVKTPKHVYKAIQNQLPADTELVLVDFAEQFVLFSPYPVTHFGFHSPIKTQIAAAYRWQTNHPKAVVLIDMQLLDGHCYDPAKAVHVGFAHRVDWVLLMDHARLPECQADGPAIRDFHYSPVNIGAQK
ncbi:ArnT family glycosyltransferase [Rheinheimera sp.]|uniref:ArnT family glycosyltransferase n=1 Tax=Rheinheimera sp. TaxID=1869214 RepID=UPI003D2CF066